MVIKTVKFIIWYSCWGCRTISYASLTCLQILCGRLFVDLSWTLFSKMIVWSSAVGGRECPSWGAGRRRVYCAWEKIQPR